MFEFAPDGYLLTSPTGVIEEANHAAANLLGVAAEYLTGKPLIVYVAKAEHAVLYQALDQLARDPGPQRWAMALQPRQGEARRTAVLASASYDAHGQISHLRWMLHDVTERQQAEEALRQSEARAQAMLRTIPDLMFRLDRQGVFLDYKADIQDLYLQANPIGLRNRDIAPPDFADLIEQQIDLTLQTRTLHTFEYQLPVSGRGLRDYEARMAPSGDDEVTAIVRDITERKQMEAALRQSEQRYHDLYENAPDMYFSVDASTGQIVHCNQTAARVTGYNAQDLIGRPIMDLYDPACRDAARQALHQFRTTGQIRDVELQICCQNGDRRDVNLTATAIRDAAGQIVRSRSSWRDITASKQTEAALRENEEKYRRLFETAQDGILILDADTSQVVEVNPFLMDMLGYSHADFLGKKIWELGIFTDRAANKFNFRELQQYDYIRYEDLPLETADGRPIDVEFISNTYRVNRQKVIQCNIRDITDRKRAQDALRELNATLEQHVADRTHQLAATNDQLVAANLRLHELDQLKEQFISRISHELRTPLTSIKIYLEMLDRVSPEKRVQYMQVLTKQTNRLQDLIENLLAVTEQSVNPAGLHLVPTDLNHLVASLAATAAPRATTHGLTLTATLTPDLPLVAADAILLSQALSNLTTNALNYTPAGGAIELSTALVTDEAQTWLTVTVRDTGPGIAPDEQAHIFERFYRGRAAADYTVAGAGVGLSISRDILAALDGRLTVQSDGVSGHGAAFTAWLKAVA